MSAVTGPSARFRPRSMFSSITVTVPLMLLLVAAFLTAAWHTAAGGSGKTVALSPQTISCFTTDADAFTDSVNPDATHAIDRVLPVLGAVGGSDQKQLFAHFDLSGIPGAAVIISATLELDMQSSQTRQVATVLAAAELAWNESTLTWNNQPPTVGGFDSQIHDSTPGIKTWNASSLVTQWHDSTLANNGLVLLPEPGFSVQADYASRENAPETPPTLCVNWQDNGSTPTRTPRPTWTPIPTSTATPGSPPPPPTPTPVLSMFPLLPLKPVAVGPFPIKPDLSVHGIEITQGIQCFDTSKGLAGCPNNSLPVIAKKDSTARIYLRYSGLGSGLNQVPVRLLIRANNVWYQADVTGRATPNINQGSSDSADVYFNVNFSHDEVVDFYAVVDPANSIAETNENNNRFPTGAGNYITLNFRRRDDLTITGQRLRYHPSGYSGSQYAAGWAVNGGAADWLEQLLPIRNNGVSYRLQSGYLDWTTSLGSGGGQHALIQYLNAQWILRNAMVFWFGVNAFTGADHVYGWAPDAGYSGGHADMPIYPHAGGLGVVAIGTDRPGTSTDNPGGGALIFGHELVHDYNVYHTNTGSDDCGSNDNSSNFPYSTSSIQEFGFNPRSGKIYDPALTHDLMSYCPSGGSKQGWISPFTWNTMFTDLALVASQTAFQTLDETAVKVFRQTGAAESLVVHASVFNPAHPDYDPGQPAEFAALHRIDGGLAYSLPSGPYAVELRQGSSVLSTSTFTVSFKSEYDAHGGGTLDDPPFPPEPTERADLSFIMPWIDGTDKVVLTYQGSVLAQRSVSANAPQVTITDPTAPITWTAGLNPSLSWIGADADQDTLSYSVLYSYDAGATWQLLTSEYGGTSLQLDVDALAGSNDARFRVVASDGINAGFAETPAAIVIPNKAPLVTLIEPEPNQALLPGQLVVLVGSATDLEDGNIPDEALTWTSDRQGELGHGSSLALNVLETGTHVITLTSHDSHGALASEFRTIFIGYQLFLPAVAR